MFFKSRSALLTAMALSVIAPGSAHAFDDHQSWNASFASAKLTENLSVMNETHFRFFRDVSILGQFMARPQVTYNVSRHFSFTGGYAYVRTRPSPGVVTNEHRTWEQIGYTGLTLGVWQLSGRTRIEQRYFEGRADTGWRLRQLARATFPVQGAVQGLLWNETFVGLNQTSWGQRANLDQSRSFVGVAWKISDTHSLEPGAMHQRVFRNGPDADNIVLSVTLISRF